MPYWQEEATRKRFGFEVNQDYLMGHVADLHLDVLFHMVNKQGRLFPREIQEFKEIVLLVAERGDGGRRSELAPVLTQLQQLVAKDLRFNIAASDQVSPPPPVFCTTTNLFSSPGRQLWIDAQKLAKAAKIEWFRKDMLRHAEIEENRPSDDGSEYQPSEAGDSQPPELLVCRPNLRSANKPKATAGVCRAARVWIARGMRSGRVSCAQEAPRERRGAAAGQAVQEG